MDPSTSKRRARRSPRARWRDALESHSWLVCAIPVIVCLGFLLWQQTRPESLAARVCGGLYAGARSAADTAAADQTVVETRAQPGRTCGDLRAGGEILPRR